MKKKISPTHMCTKTNWHVLCVLPIFNVVVLSFHRKEAEESLNFLRFKFRLVVGFFLAWKLQKIKNKRITMSTIKESLGHTHMAIWTHQLKENSYLLDFRFQVFTFDATICVWWEMYRQGRASDCAEHGDIQLNICLFIFRMPFSSLLTNAFSAV